MKPMKCDNCGKTLRVDNQSGICSDCRRAGVGVHPAKVAEPPGAGSRDAFFAVTKAFGLDPDGMLEGFMAGWLKRVHLSVASVVAAKPDEPVLP